MAYLIIVDDDPSLRDMLVDSLVMAGHDVRAAADARALDELLQSGVPELFVLDVSLPGEDGLSIARRLRQSHDPGIIMLTGADDVVDKVAGLEVGADDYVTKPFSLREFGARIDAVLRRRRFLNVDTLPFGTFSLDLRNWRLLDAAGKEIPFTPTEVDLIAAFASNPGRMLSRDQLLRLAPAHQTEALDRSIDARVKRLRQKLERFGYNSDLIETKRGHGYIFHGPSSTRHGLAV